MSKMRMKKVEVMIATPLEEELAARVEEVDERVELLYEAALLPPRRYVSDHKGDPDFKRSVADERRWRGLLERAEIVFGVPGESAEGLAVVLERGRRLRWVQATNAGTGQQVLEAGIFPEELERVAVTTASGVHATPLAEFCLHGLLHFARQMPRLTRLKR
ncbi:MAG: D-2-hydroxyacid dehydrogenase, partial [Gemmatimonadetes bacterium]|nr:D-2-hydroxyacid dehydrogenase [Gemmatimonadota bacterium]